jgi:GrpB-like predicted nucleotidyltransferase (UPF0157 family)
MAHGVTREGERWSNSALDRVELVDPDPSWGKQYEAEAAALNAAIGPTSGLRLEHFGSTSIPNIRAKPIIDILLIHPNPARWPELIEPITSLGYVYWADNPRKDRMFFVKGMPPFGSRRTHHVHVRTPADALAEVTFRDALRVDTRLAQEYENLKETLAKRHSENRDAYTDGKGDFVAKVLTQVPSNNLLQQTGKERPAAE